MQERQDWISRRGPNGMAQILGFAGRDSPMSRSVRATVLSALPGFELIGSKVDDAGAPVAWVAVPADRRLAAVDQSGSFLVLAGGIHDETEVEDLFHRWLDHGESALQSVYFQGVMAAWDSQSRRFVLLRDRYGVESGYYSQLAGGVVFADEQRSLLAAGVDDTVDPEAIDSFLACGYFPAPLSPYVAISKLSPGGRLQLDGETPRIDRWTTYERKPEVAREDALARAPMVIQTAVERLLPDSGEIGLLLSGGIDSAMLLAAITKMAGRKATAFTFRYDDYDGPLNEYDAARVVSTHLDVDHQEIRIGPSDLMDDLDSAVAAYGEPLNWGLHSYQLGPLVAAGIGTVFSGVGADGTGLTKRHSAALRFSAMPTFVRSVVRTAVRGLRPLQLGAQTRAEWVTQKADSVASLFSPDSPFSQSQRSALYRDAELAQRGGQRLARIFEETASLFDPNDPKTALVVMDKLFTSAEAMMAWNRAWPRAHELTAALPYYDPDMIDLGLQVEGDLSGKDLIREVATRYLPMGVVRAPKIAQQMPVSHWLRGALAERAEERLRDLPNAMADIFDRSTVRSLVRQHRDGRVDLGWRIVSMLTLESWFRQRMDRTGSRASTPFG